MTCICAISNGETVWMGGDSLGADNRFNCSVRKDKKVFISGEYLIGFTSSFRMGDILKWSFEPPEMDDKEKNIEKFMANTFISSVIRALDDNGYGKTENNQKEGGEFLVGVRGKIFHVHSDYQIGLYQANFDACGCGRDLALGSLYTTHKVGKLSNPKRLEMALEAAQNFSAGVRSPWTILKIGK